MILITYKTHSIGSLFIGLISLLFPLRFIFEYFDISTISIMFALYLLSLQIGSSFPDIDQPTSHIGRKFPVISQVIKNKFGHRGFMHSLLFIYCLILLSFLINIILKIFFSDIYYNIHIYIYTLEFGFILGSISHILLDMLNKGGVCILYPDNKKYRLKFIPIIKYDSIYEKALSNFLSILSSILLIYYLYLFLKLILFI